MQMSSQLQFLLRLLNVDEYYIHLCDIVSFSIMNLIIENNKLQQAKYRQIKFIYIYIFMSLFLKIKSLLSKLTD